MLGGGLLGLEAAKAVYDLPTIKDVAIIHRQAYPLSRQLDAQGGEIVLRRIESMGVRFLGGTSVQRLVTDDKGALSGRKSMVRSSLLPTLKPVFQVLQVESMMHLPRGNVTVLPLRPKVLLKRSPIEIPSQESTRSIVTFVLRLSQAAFP